MYIMHYSLNISKGVCNIIILIRREILKQQKRIKKNKHLHSHKLEIDLLFVPPSSDDERGMTNQLISFFI